MSKTYYNPQVPRSKQEMFDIFGEQLVKQVAHQKILEYQEALDELNDVLFCASKKPQLDYFIIFDQVTPLKTKAERHIRRLNVYLEKEKAGKITEDDIQCAKDVPIIDVVSRYGIDMPPAFGGRHKIPCPFHEEKTPSLVIYTHDNSWYCFGACGRGGDNIDFITSMEDISFLDAVRKLIN